MAISRESNGLEVIGHERKGKSAKFESGRKGRGMHKDWVEKSRCTLSMKVKRWSQ